MNAIQNALLQAMTEAAFQHEFLAHDVVEEERFMATAKVVATFLHNIPVGLDAGTLLAEVQTIANG